VNVLMLAPMIPPDCYGGAGRSTLELIEGLSARGVRVYAISPTTGPNSVESNARYEIERIRVSDAPYSSVGIVQRRRVFRERLNQLLAGTRFDLVHDSGGYFYGDVLHDLRTTFGGPIMVQFRTCLPELLATQDPGTHPGVSANTMRSWAIEQERRYVRAADHIVCLAYHIAQRVQSLYNSNAVVIRTGLCPHIPTNKHRATVIKVLLAGRLHDVAKGAEFGLSVLRGLVDARGDIEGIVTFQAPPRQDAARINFVGVLSFPDFDELMRRVDIVLVPSAYDCSPRVVLEAMQWGHLVVARESLGTREIIESGHNGLLFSPGAEAGEIVHMILRALSDWDCVTELGQKAFETISEHYNFDCMIAETIGAYRETIDIARCRRSRKNDLRDPPTD